MSPQRPETHPKRCKEDDTKEPALKTSRIDRGTYRKLVGISHAQ